MKEKKSRTSNSDEIVTVIILTYNRPLYLERAVQSVVSQTYKYVRILVYNDCSSSTFSDSYKAVYQRIKKYSQVTIIDADQNRGNSAARNFALRQVTSKYVTFLDDDDEWLPDKLEKQVALIRKTNSDVAFCGTIWMESGRVLKSRVLPSKISFERGGPTSVWLLKTDVFGKIGAFDERLPANVDGEFLVRINKNLKTCYVPEDLYVHNYHQSQMTNSAKNKAEGFRIMIQKHMKSFTKEELSIAYFKFVFFSYFAGHRQFRALFSSLSAKIKLKSLLLLFVMCLPVRWGTFVLGEILNFQNYPRGFLGRK